MDWINGIQKAIDYIEEHLTEDIDYNNVAAVTYSSSHHFQRVFSILSGMTLGEYIRSRRLTLAGSELASSDVKIIDVALKYGYESPDSFSKAFQKFHGVSPSQARKDANNLKSFSRLSIELSLKGGSIMNYRIEEKQSITLVGHRIHCDGKLENVENAFTQTRQHWLNSRDLQRYMKTIRNNDSIWYDIYTDFMDDEFSHIIAVDTADVNVSEDRLEVFTVTEHLYVIFETEHCESPDDLLPSLMKRIISEWFPSTDYVMSNKPQINKVFFEKEYSKRYIEVWIPIEKQ